jgi:hypothetical protein
MSSESITERASTVIKIETLDDGTYRATQHDVDVEGRGDNPARAVMEFAAEVERIRYT